MHYVLRARVQSILLHDFSLKILLVSVFLESIFEGGAVRDLEHQFREGNIDIPDPTTRAGVAIPRLSTKYLVDPSRLRLLTCEVAAQPISPVNKIKEQPNPFLAK